MKTKHSILKTVGMVLMAFWMVSCQDLLTEDPKGQLAVVNFFKEKGDLDLALNAMYSILAQDQYANNQIGCNFAAGDDISTHPAANKQSIREFDTYAVSNNNAWMEALWGARWRLVKAANFIINNAGRTPDVSQEEIDAAIGQAYYWRAYSYFYLVSAWGAVPKIVKDEVDYNAPLAPVAEIYELIASDLKAAESMVPDNYSKEPYARNGMNIAVSKGAVQATLAYVYMAMAGWPLNRTEYYALAAAKAKEVIDAVEKGTYYYKLLDQYKQVYSVAWNNKNPEVLLGVYYNREVGSLQNTPACDFLADMAYGGGWGDTNGEIKFWKDFPDGPRKEATYFPKIILMKDEESGKLSDWWVDPNPAEPRAVVAPCFMKTVEGSNRGEDFDYTNSASIGFEGEKMHQVIRLSEVYCWYAEAVGRSGQGDKTKAVEVLNKVRNRADGTTSNRYSTSMSYNDLAEAAYNEHGWEIAGYYWGNIAPRSMDLFRMNRIKDHFEYRKLNPEIEVAPGVFRKEAVPVNGVWNDNKMYLPYPNKDAVINPNLKN